MYRLVYLTGPRQGRRLTVQEGDVLLGSAPECPIRLANPAVAPQQAVLQFQPDGIHLKQLAPGARLTINGKPVTQQQLVHGDEMGIANDRFLFQLAEPTKTKPRRSSSTHKLTQIAVGGILLAQVLVIIGLLIYRQINPITVAVQPDPEQARHRLRAQLQHHTANGAHSPIDATTDGRFEWLPPYIVVPQYTRPDENTPTNRLPINP